MRAAPSIGLAAVFALVLAVSATTSAELAGAISVKAIAASPSEIGEGRWWLLLTSGMFAQSPLVPSLLTFAALAFSTCAICGSRVLWTAAIVGHVWSTLAAYLALELVRLADPNAYELSISAPDYGVSAICAAWIGAIAARAWTRPGRSGHGRAVIAALCLGSAVYGWLLRGAPPLGVLDSEHVLAFILGVATCGVTRRSSRRHAAAAVAR